MEFKLLFHINHLLLNGFSLCETPDFSICNDHSFRQSFYTEDFLCIVGKTETLNPKENAFAYYTFYNNEDLVRKDALNELSSKMMEKMQYLDGFLNFLWFIKDNCVSVDRVIGQIPSLKEGVVKLSSNSHAWNSLGIMEDTLFSEEEMKKAVEIGSKYSSICTQEIRRIDEHLKNEIHNKALQMGHSEDFNHNTYNSLQRAFVFLGGARKINYLPYRIAMYMPIFECLFSTDAQEATQKISERVAFYLTNDKFERMEIFKAVHDGYDCRSRFLHGDVFKPRYLKTENTKPLSIQIDNIARRVLTKVIMEDSDKFLDVSKNLRREYIEGIIFQ